MVMMDKQQKTSRLCPLALAVTVAVLVLHGIVAWGMMNQMAIEQIESQQIKRHPAKQASSPPKPTLPLNIEFIKPVEERTAAAIITIPPVKQSVVKPVMTAVAKPVEAKTSVLKSAVQPSIKLAPKSDVKPAAKPAAKPSIQPTPQSDRQPTAKPTTKAQQRVMAASPVRPAQQQAIDEQAAKAQQQAIDEQQQRAAEAKQQAIAKAQQQAAVAKAQQAAAEAQQQAVAEAKEAKQEAIAAAQQQAAAIAEASNTPQPLSQSDARWQIEPTFKFPASVLTLAHRGEVYSVTIKMTVDQQGNISKPTLVKSSGNAKIDGAALQSLRWAKFYPFLKQGVPIFGYVTVSFDYQIP